MCVQSRTVSITHIINVEVTTEFLVTSQPKQYIFLVQNTMETQKVKLNSGLCFNLMSFLVLNTRLPTSEKNNPIQNRKMLKNWSSTTTAFNNWKEQTQISLLQTTRIADFLTTVKYADRSVQN